jgi:hypothetical protein
MPNLMRLNVISFAAFSIWGVAHAEDINRNPECAREAAVIDNMLLKIHSAGAPQGQQIMGPMNDPRYNDGNWYKYQYAEIDRVHRTVSPETKRYVVTVHYLYNIKTGATAQVKLKNTHHSGCVGTWVKAWNGDTDVLVARPAYEYSGNFDTVWSAYSYQIVVGPMIESYSIGCVHVDSLLPDGRRAGDIKVGDKMELADEKVFDPIEKKFKSSIGIVTYSKLVSVNGVKITTTSGISLLCSDSAPLPTENGLVDAPYVLGKKVPVKSSIEKGAFCAWEEVVSVESVGLIDVQHITVGDKCFWAGEKQDGYILHHNLKMIEFGAPESFWPWW